MSERRTLEPEDQIARYRVLAPLASGGMGEVYVARDQTLDRSVALKVLPARLVRSEERVRRFITEAKSASSLNHPNIVTIYEIGQDRVRAHESAAAGATDAAPESDPIHFISMELVEGETLGRKIYESETDLRTLVGWLAQAAEGIAKAHAAGIVHRDLKPGNIMVSNDGFAKVLDFGLAKLTERQGDPAPDATSAPTVVPATKEGTVLGTSGYMSPEQVLGKPVDARSDIFSMGCLLYEAATRRRPFAAETDIEVMHRILRDSPAPIEEIAPLVPSELRRIIRRCLAKLPEQRFQSMKDLAIELREVCEQHAAPAAPRPARRSVVLGIAAAVVLAVFAVSLYALIDRRAGGVADRPLPAHEMKMSVLMSRDDLDEAVLSSDGRYLAYVTHTEGKSTLKVRQVRTGSDVVILPPQEYLIVGVSFSPDGDYLYYLNQDPGLPSYNALFQVPSLGGTPRKVAFDVDSAAGFSSDGKHACFLRAKPVEKASTIQLLDLASGKERELTRLAHPVTVIAPPALSPDGRRIAVPVHTTASGGRAWISVFDVEKGTEEKLEGRSFTALESVGWMPDGNSLVCSASMPLTSAPFQLYRIEYPGGQTRRITNDLSGYTSVSVSSAGESIAAIRGTGTNNLWIAPIEPGGETRSLTSATGATSSAGEPTPMSGGAVAYVIQEGDHPRLLRTSADGSERKEMVPQGGVVSNVRYSEKSGVVFTRFDDEGIPHVWRVDPDGADLRQLTTGKGEVLTDLSRDGKLATIKRMDDFTSIYALDPVLGGEPKLLTTENKGGSAPLISPDGTRVMYLELTMIDGRAYMRHVIAPSSGGVPLARFVLPPGAFTGNAFAMCQWSPDGRSVTYIDRNEGWNLMLRPIAGGTAVPLTHFTEGRAFQFAWSPDGQWIAVPRRIGQTVGLWLVKPGKGDARPLKVFESGSVFGARWTADSRNVLFVHGIGGQDVVLISDIP